MKKLLQNKKEANRGITLIALIITIIVLLILAGVTIATLTGENGILTQAKNAKNEMTKAEAKERIQLEVLGSYGTDGEIDIATLKANIAKNIPEAVIGEETELPLTVTVGDYTFIVNANGTLEEAREGGNDSLVGKIVEGENMPYTNNGDAVIPVGFMIVPGCEDVSEGLVISDNPEDTEEDPDNIVAEGNQFVWIPVTEENLFERRAGYEWSSQQGISGYTEADASGSNSKIEESEETQAEAIAMYKSVSDNGGFYIGRYEVGKDSLENIVCKKEADPYTNIKWGKSMTDETGGAVEVARNFAEENDYDSVTSTLCYGVQWDTALNFIDPGYTGYAKKSTKMGWYEDNYNSTSTGNTTVNPEHITGKDLIYTSEVSVSGSGSQSGSESTAVIIPAGEPTNKHKNIYDMAGNMGEWTMETVTSITQRVTRGGSWIDKDRFPASWRYALEPQTEMVNLGMRISLYL